MQYSDLHIKIMFTNPHSSFSGEGWRSVFKENIFARNSVKCADLHRKAMFGNLQMPSHCPHVVGWHTWHFYIVLDFLCNSKQKLILANWHLPYPIRDGGLRIQDFVYRSRPFIQLLAKHLCKFTPPSPLLPMSSGAWHTWIFCPYLDMSFNS